MITRSGKKYGDDAIVLSMITRSGKKYGDDAIVLLNLISVTNEAKDSDKCPYDDLDLEDLERMYDAIELSMSSLPPAIEHPISITKETKDSDKCHNTRTYLDLDLECMFACKDSRNRNPNKEKKKNCRRALLSMYRFDRISDGKMLSKKHSRFW